MAATKKKTEVDVPVVDIDEPVTVDVSNIGVNDDDNVKEQLSEHDENLDKLEPRDEPKRWVIGKPPEHGGKATEYSIYYQKKLGFMARNRFFSLIGKVMSKAIRETGGSVGGMSDVFGNQGGTIKERVGKLQSRDFQDASSFFEIAMELVAYSPDLLLEIYSLSLGVPANEKQFFMDVLEQDWDPEEDQWGITDDQGQEMFERFIDQNYEDMRRFFTETLPTIARRVSEKEKARNSSSE